MKLSRLYKVDDNSVFYKTNLDSVRQEYYNGLRTGTMQGYATDLSPMSSEEATQAFLLMADYFKPLNTSEEVLRNIEVSKFLIAVVREELLNETDGEIYINKLKDVIISLQTGAFDVASGILLGMIPDDVITTERLDRWSDLCLCADAMGSTIGI
jgi:hypothetical protein